MAVIKESQLLIQIGKTPKERQGLLQSAKKLIDNKIVIPNNFARPYYLFNNELRVMVNNYDISQLFDEEIIPIPTIEELLKMVKIEYIKYNQEKNRFEAKPIKYDFIGIGEDILESLIDLCIKYKENNIDFYS